MKHKPAVSLIALLGTVAISAMMVIALSIFAATDRVHETNEKMVGAPNSNDRIIIQPELLDFQEIAIVGKWRIELKQGHDRQLKLSYPQNVSHWVRWEITRNRLVLKFDPPLLKDTSSIVATARITIPEFRQLDLEGYNQVRLQGFHGEQFTLNIKGTNHIDGDNGYYTTLNLFVAGLNHVNLDTLRVRDAEVHIKGNNQLTLYMDGGRLSGFLAGVGALDYHGTVSAQTVRIAGLAHVKELD